jgi:DNA-binding transcriptional MerR regulator
MKRGGGRRYYRPEDIDLLRGIRHLLYGDGYTIRGVQRILREQGVRTVQSVGQGRAVNLPAPPQQDAQDENDESNGAPGVIKFPTPLFPGTPDETRGGVEDQDPDDSGELAVPQFVPQKRPMQEATSAAVPALAKSPGAAQIHQASPPVAAPQLKAVAAEDLERLKHALAELEACRRLLDRANEGG